jgi:hypothetical protein
MVTYPIGVKGTPGIKVTLGGKVIPGGKVKPEGKVGGVPVPPGMSDGTLKGGIMYGGRVGVCWLHVQLGAEVVGVATKLVGVVTELLGVVTE